MPFVSFLGTAALFDGFAFSILFVGIIGRRRLVVISGLLVDAVFYIIEAPDRDFNLLFQEFKCFPERVQGLSSSLLM